MNEWMNEWMNDWINVQMIMVQNIGDVLQRGEALSGIYIYIYTSTNIQLSIEWIN